MAHTGNPALFAQALGEGGYGTDEHYGQALAALIDQFKLTQYDAPAGPASVAT